MNLSQVRGVKLPSSRTMFSRGYTSVLYSTPTGLTVLTLEPIKFDWWVSLGIISDYRQEGVYHCAGYETLNRRVERDLPLFMAVNVPILPYAADKVARTLDEVRIKRSPDYLRWWENLSKSRNYPVKEPALFLLDQPIDLGMYRPDYSAKDMLSWKKRTVCIDPMHDIRLDKWLDMKEEI